MSYDIPKLLCDEPESKDAFGAHRRIATALATLIETSVGGKSVRLDGTWGAGKSTVIRLLSEMVEGCGKAAPATGLDVAVFQYDAWVHSGDGLRRAFIEALVANLRTRKWIKEGSELDDDWEKKLSAMAGKLKSVTKLTRPTFTKRARTIIAVIVTGAFMAPAFISLVGSLLSGLDAEKLIGLFFMTASILFWLLYRVRDADLRVFLTKSTLEESTDTLSEPDPTSIEFQRTFKELMEAVLSENRRLVLVIDNLDRVGATETKQIWALLRSFLDNPAFRSEKWFPRIWTIVPIADEAKVLQSTNGGDVSPVTTNKPEVDFGYGFLEKVFQIRFSLPLPMLQSWKTFLGKKLIDTFGPDVKQQYEDILRLVHVFYPDASPTPRAMLAFLNELIALHIERRGDIDLSILAGYILSRLEPRANGWVVPQKVARILEKYDVHGRFATLYLHADLEQDAFYLLVWPLLQRALEQGSPDALREVLGSSVAKADVLEKNVLDELEGMDDRPELFFAYVRALQPLACADATGSSSDTPLRVTFLPHLRSLADNVFSKVRTLNLHNPNLANGLRSYLELTKERSNATARLLNLLRQLPAGSDQSGTNATPGAFDLWMRVLFEILSIDDIKQSLAAKGESRIVLPLSPERWTELCFFALSDPSLEWIAEVCEGLGGEEVIEKWIVDCLKKNMTDVLVQTILRHETHIRGVEFFGRVAESVTSPMRLNKDVNPRGALDVLSVLTSISRTEVRPFVETLFNDGSLCELVAKSESSDFVGKSEVAISLVVFILWAGGGERPQLEVGNSPAVMGYIEKLCRGEATLMPSQRKTVVELILSLRLYDVLGAISSLGRDDNSILPELLAELCKDKQFFSEAEAEVSSNGQRSNSMVPDNAEAHEVKELLRRAVETQRTISV